MLRFLSILTLVLVAVCIVLGASIALADQVPAPGLTAQQRTIEAVDPDRRTIDSSLAAGGNLPAAAATATS